MAGLIAVPLPFLGAAFGWIFTEMGRQPWVVHPNMAGLEGGTAIGNVFQLTEVGISTSVSGGAMLTSLILFTVLYGVLGVVWFWLMRRYVLEGVSPLDTELSDEPKQDVETSTDSLYFGY